MPNRDHALRSPFWEKLLQGESSVISHHLRRCWDVCPKLHEDCSEQFGSSNLRIRQSQRRQCSCSLRCLHPIAHTAAGFLFGQHLARTGQMFELAPVPCASLCKRGHRLVERPRVLSKELQNTVPHGQGPAQSSSFFRAAGFCSEIEGQVLVLHPTVLQLLCQQMGLQSFPGFRSCTLSRLFSSTSMPSQ